jgi:hypothetical protein
MLHWWLMWWHGWLIYGFLSTATTTFIGIRRPFRSMMLSDSDNQHSMWVWPCVIFHWLHFWNMGRFVQIWLVGSFNFISFNKLGKDGHWKTNEPKENWVALGFSSRKNPKYWHDLTHQKWSLCLYTWKKW